MWHTDRTSNMNLLHFIVVAILVAAGYLLHDPLIGDKGVLASLVRQFRMPLRLLQNLLLRLCQIILKC